MPRAKRPAARRMCTSAVLASHSRSRACRKSGSCPWPVRPIPAVVLACAVATSGTCDPAHELARTHQVAARPLPRAAVEYTVGLVVDNCSPTVRSRIMASVGQKNTAPEMAVRRLLHGLGYRYGLHRSDLPGRPDLVFAPRHKVVFVHGCFWHGHDCRKGRLPSSRVHYWSQKIDDNRARDARNVGHLQADGWEICIVWECETSDLHSLGRRLVRFLDHRTSSPDYGSRA